MKNITAYDITEFIDEMLSPLSDIEAEAIDLANNLKDKDDKMDSLRRIQDCIGQIRERNR